MHIFKQLVKVGFGDDYLYDRSALGTKHIDTVISLNPQRIDGIHKHFATPKKKSQLVAHISLTEHDYENMYYIAKYADIFNAIIKKYSTLDIVYPSLSHEDVNAIPSALVLEYSIDFAANIFVLKQKKLSSQTAFVLLYLKTIELIEICVDIYNEFERKNDMPLLTPLKHTVAFVDNNRSLKNLPHVVNPSTWSHLI